MTPKEISKMIEREINGDWSATNWHSCDLKKCLVRPKRRKVHFGSGLKGVWIVLEERPENLDGQQIYFDEETEKFGVVIPSNAFGFACNSHETFLEAFKSM
jgi:hypothetical protein